MTQQTIRLVAPGYSAEERQRTAVTFSLILAAALALASLGGFFLARGGSSIVPPVANLAAAAAAFGSALLCRRGRVLVGTGVMLALLVAGLLIALTTTQGIGALAVVILAIVPPAVISQTWPRRLIRLGLLGAALAVVVAVGVDLLWPGFRPPLPAGQRALVTIFAAAGLLVMLVVVARRFPSFSLRNKLVIAFLTITLVPLVTFTTINLRTTRAVLTAEANAKLFSAATQTAASLDGFLENGMGTVRTEAHLLDAAGYIRLAPEARPGSPEAEWVLAHLKTYRDKDPLGITSYALLDLTGQVVAASPPVEGAPNEARWDYFSLPIEMERPYLSPVYFDPATDEPFFVISAPTYAHDTGDLVGVLRARYKASVLQEQIARSTGQIGGQSFAVLFDENLMHLGHGAAPETLYTLVGRPPEETLAALQASYRLPGADPHMYLVDLPDLEANLQRAAQTPFFEAEDIATGDRLNQVAVTSLRTRPWRVAFFEPQGAFLAPAERQGRSTILLLTAVAFGAIVTALGLAQILTAPIGRLTTVAARVSQGDLSAQAVIESPDEIGILAHTFNTMTGELRQMLDGLEQKVTERTRALEASAQVSRSLSTILDSEELVAEVVEQVRTAFDYYHVHIYLKDAERNKMVMAGGTGEAGRLMLAAGHTLEPDQGLVGQAAEINAPVLVRDVTTEPNYLANPLLPETRAEVAVPIAVGERVLGVLDVQHNVVGGLDRQDEEMLLSIANQVAVALQNGRYFEESRRQAARESLINDVNQKIQGATTVAQAMQIAVREVGRALGAQETQISLRQPDAAAPSQAVDQPTAPLNGAGSANGQHDAGEDAHE